jgi:DNA-binding winged helix-turn-helix (wHTH) protein/TolB-like protein
LNSKTLASRVRIGSSTFDPARAELLGQGGDPVHLRPQAMRVLEMLLAHAGRVVTRDDLIAEVWPGVVVTDDSLVQCIGDIRRALGSDHRLLHTVPRLGYRLDVAPATDPEPAVDRAPDRWKTFAASIDAVVGRLVAAVVGDPDGASETRAAAWGPRHSRAIAWGGAAVVLALLGWLIGHDGGPLWGRGALAPGLSPTVAVRFRYDAPTAALKEPAATFAAGVADQFVADLVRNTELRSVSVPATAGDASVGELSRRLGTQLVVEGRVQVRPTGLLLTVELVDGSNGSVLWVDRREARLEQLAVDREALLRRIARSAHASMRLEADAVVLPMPPRSLDVYLPVTRALARVHRFDRDEYRIAREELAQALQREPEFALAWAVLGWLDAVDAIARITGDLSDERSSDLVAQADRAIALDPRLTLAHQARSLALVNAGYRAEALKAAEGALRLSPLDPQSYLVLANALVANTRMAEATRAIDQAQSRYPVPPVVFDYVRAKVLWGNDRFDEAVGAASRCLEKVPHFVACRGVRAVASDAMGRLEAAREDLKEYRVTVPGAPTHTLGPGSYGVPKLKNDWLAEIRSENGLP